MDCLLRAVGDFSQGIRGAVEAPTRAMDVSNTERSFRTDGGRCFVKFSNWVEGVKRHRPRDPRGDIRPLGGAKDPGAKDQACKMYCLLYRSPVS